MIIRSRAQPSARILLLGATSPLILFIITMVIQNIQQNQLIILIHASPCGNFGACPITAKTNTVLRIHLTDRHAGRWQFGYNRFVKRGHIGRYPIGFRRRGSQLRQFPSHHSRLIALQAVPMLPILSQDYGQ